MPTIQGGYGGTSSSTKKTTQTITPKQPTALSQGNAPSGPQYATSSAATSIPAGLPSQGTNPYHGFASRYNPAALQEQIWRDPQMVLNSMFGDSGQSIYSPLYATMRDFYGADPQSLWLLTKGNTQGQFGNAGDYANFLNSMYGNYQTPGGRAFSFAEILQNLAGLTDQSGLSAQDQSPLWQTLSAGTASDQARTLYGLLGDAAKVGLSPTVASAFLNSLATQMDSYLAQNGTTPGGAPLAYQYFQNPMTGR